MIKQCSFLTVLCSLTLVACNTVKTNVMSIENTSWQLQSVLGKEVSEKVTLLFEDNKLSGQSFCNRYFSQYERVENQLKIESVGATKMACPNLKVEQQYFNLLREAERYERKGENLYIQHKNGQLVFIPLKNEQTQ